MSNSSKIKKCVLLKQGKLSLTLNTAVSAIRTYMSRMVTLARYRAAFLAMKVSVLSKKSLQMLKTSKSETASVSLGSLKAAALVNTVQLDAKPFAVQ